MSHQKQHLHLCVCLKFSRVSRLSANKIKAKYQIKAISKTMNNNDLEITMLWARYGH